MQILVILGLVMVAGALIALGYCIRQALVLRARPDDARAKLSRLAAVNLAALCAAGLGLGLVTIGLLL